MAILLEDVIYTIKEVIQADPATYSDGFHIVGHSQGILFFIDYFITLKLIKNRRTTFESFVDDWFVSNH